MKLRAAACLALALVAGAPVLAQNAQPKPDRAPGVQAERINSLMVGDRAPELAISQWVKGDEITGFEEGRVYVVEFWATWCGPCIAGMPHVSELQKEYKDQGVTMLGVNIWDEPEKVAPFMQHRERNGEAQPSGDELMKYTVAIEKKIEGENIRYGEMANNWMKAAGQNGIPTAFIVDQKGYVAWIGHPMRMDEPLEKVVAGRWDIKAAAEDFAEGAKRDAEQRNLAAERKTVLAPITKALQAKDYPAFYKALEAGMDNALIWDDPMTLNQYAWAIVDPDQDIADRNAGLGVKLAERAAELSEHKDPAILDTLAWGYYFSGAKAKAIATETKAIGLLSDDQKAEYQKSLERMKQ